MSLPSKVIHWSFYLLFFLVPLIFLPNTSELFEFNKMVVTYFLTAIITGAWITEIILKKRFIFKRTSLDWPILIFLVTQLLSYLVSIDPRTSLLGYYSRFNGGLISMLCYSLLYWAFVTFMDRKSTLNAIAYSLLPTAILVCFYGILQHFGIDDQIWVQDVKNRVFSTLGQPNWLAAYLVALIYIPLSKIVKPQIPNSNNQINPKIKTFEKLKFENYLVIGNWLFVILLFITLLFTKSRSGLLAFGISSVVFWGLTIFQNITPFPPLRLRGGIKEGVIKPFLVFFLLTLTLTLTISNPLRDQYVLKYFSNSPPTTYNQKQTGPALEVGGTESGVIRKIVWTGALRIWQSSAKTFWLGSGPETFAMAYYQHRPIEHNSTSEWELLYNKAHNEFLNYLATTGLLGLGSYLLLLCAMFYQFIKSGNKNSQFSILNSALLSGWLTISITNFWGFSVVIVNIFLFLLPALAYSLNTPSDNIPNPPLKLKPWQILLLLISCSSTLFIFYSISKYWLADVYYASGQKYLKSFTATEDPTYILSSYNSLLSAYEANSADPSISSDLATIMAYMALLTTETDSTASSQLAATAIAVAHSSVLRSPYHPNYYKAASRTAIILSTLDPKYLDTAEEALKSAQIISPTDPRIPYNLSAVQMYKQDYISAKKYLDAALRLKPDFADAQAQQVELASVSGKIER